MGFGDRVINGATLPRAAQEAAPLHQPQMVRGGRLVQTTSFRYLIHGIVIPHQQQLNYLQSIRMGQNPQTFRRIAQGVEIELQRLLDHQLSSFSNNISEYLNMSIIILWKFGATYSVTWESVSARTTQGQCLGIMLQEKIGWQTRLSEKGRTTSATELPLG
jgi:hypothetical protein